MWRVTEAPWKCCKGLVLILCGVQLIILRSGVLTELDLDKVDVAPSFVEVFRSVLSGVGGCTGGWRCCWGAPSLPRSIAPCHFEEPTPLHKFVVFVLLQKWE